MKKLVLLALLISIGNLACSGSGQQYQETTLPSGKIIKVIGIGKMYFGKDNTALMLKYQTDISIEDVNSLRREVEEIWQSFVVNVEKENLNAAIISANEPPKSTGWFTTTNRMYSFGYRKINGNWKMIEK